MTEPQDQGEMDMWADHYREELLARREDAYQGGGAKRVERQHQAGKLTARERIECLFDEGSFVEINTLVQGSDRDICLSYPHYPGDGVVTGYGKIHGRIVYCAVDDFTVNGGTLGEYHARKIDQIMDMALDMLCPFVMIHDSGGARIEEGVCSLDAFGGIFLRNTRMSGVVPQISVIMGPCAGGASYSPAICDFIFMVEQTSQMFVTGPAVINHVTSASVSPQELGGTDVHSAKSGVAHFTFPDDKSTLDGVRRLLEYLPDNYMHPAAGLYTAGWRSPDPSLIEECVPDNNRRIYDVLSVIRNLVDEDSLLEVQKDFAKNAVVAFARMQGRPCGIVANQPMGMAGALDVDASDKIARFVRFCDCFGIPLVVLVDVPGFFPSVEQEHKGIIRHGAKLLYAFSEATVPKITIILRKAYGGAYVAMCSKALLADIVYAWPIAELAVMGAEGAVDIIYRRRLAASPDPQEERKRLVDDYRKRFASPYISAASGYIDEIILPEETRDKICSALEALRNKNRTREKKFHGNIPL